MNLIILGPQGSGKGTQANLLSDKFKLNHISMGALLRQAALASTPQGKHIASLLKTGSLLPLDIVFQALEPVLKKTTSGFILDGIPRDLNQTERLHKMLSKLNHSIDHVVFITLSRESSLKRLIKRADTEGRSDDTKEAIEKRLKIYHQETRPVIEHYRKQGLVVEIDGEPDIDTIHKSILSALKI